VTTSTRPAPPAVLDDGVLESLRRDGYVVVPGFFDAETVAAAAAGAARQFPTQEDAATAPREHGLRAGLAFRVFPYEDDTLNLLGFDERLLDFMRRALDSPSVFLTQAAARASYPSPDSADQQLHRDYTNNTILVPSDDPQFGQIAVLTYLTDVTEDNAPLFVCPRTHTDDRPALPRERTRADDPELYALERPVLAPAGTAIIYTMATFHRGSKYHGSEDWRLVAHLNYRRAGCEWMSFTAFGTSFESEAAARLMVRLSPEQRSILGVPLPGHPYWTTQTIAGVRERYRGIDMTPYEQAVTA
jgi:ectoine hydroxylase-related dioxygenase (phytanoyl-CoA dioxygenase family)